MTNDRFGLGGALALMLVAGSGLSGCTATGGAARQTDELPPEQRQIVATRINLGLEYMKVGNHAQAMDVLTDARTRFPDVAGVHSALGMLNERIGDINASNLSYERAIDIDGVDANIRNNYGGMLCRKGDYEGADQQFRVALEDRLYATPWVAATNAGICAAQIPDLGRAEIYFRTALTKNPRFAPALYQMARMSLRLERYVAGLQYLDRFWKAAPKNAESLWLGVQLARAAGRKSDASQLAYELRTRFPSSPQAELLLR
ncbi:MAG: type IV pilus biogenesis/stability protein PilW [Gammaproteobacteria bacterium]